MIKLQRYLLPLTVILVLLLSSCSTSQNTSNSSSSKTEALTWGTFGTYAQYSSFLELLNNTYPEIKLDFISYTGNNRTGYSWAQMRADDIPDIFITSQILDPELAKEQLVDLSDYSFINNFSSSVLNQVEIDGGIYLLPVSYSMYGIYYNRTLMEENNWQVPTNFAELEELCKKIQAKGLIPGIIETNLTGSTFSTVFNLAKTSWLTTPEGVKWEKDFLNGTATAQGMWEETMNYIQRYIDIGMFTVDPEDRNIKTILSDYLGNRKAVFCVTTYAVSSPTITNSTDQLAMMPYIGEDGSKNIYMYSPSYYFGISKRLMEPDKKEQLEQAIKILSLLFSPKGQETVLGNNSPCTLSVLSSASVAEDSFVYDAQLALRDGRAFQMTYVNWETILSDIGQIFKDWFRGENNRDGKDCIAQMDEILQNYRTSANQLYYCESTANFTLEETAQLVGKALGSASEADAALISLNEFHNGKENPSGISGKLYAGPIDEEVKNTILPGVDGEYALITMNGAQIKELAQTGFDRYNDQNPFPYILITRDNITLDDKESYQVAFLTNGYPDELIQTYPSEIRKASIRAILRTYLKEQGRVSPNGNLWE